ncbi:MAG: hypothetical protein C0613_12155 [Desulfobulbaceae bacterium]|nr:MAG: hypothetical protein C0613_12155 [Desulfobulbaceae bacterium]
MTRTDKRDEAGFTLVELVVSMLLTGLIAIGIFSAYKAQQDNYVMQEQVAEMQQRIRAGMDMMVMELREAGYDPDITGDPGIITATATTLEFTLAAQDDGVDNNDDGTTDEDGELKTLEYSLYDQSGNGVDDTLGRKVDSGNQMPLIEGVDEMELNYILADGTEVTTPTTAQINDIRSVQISLLVRATNSDPEFNQNTSYEFGSGATSATYTDNFRRRLLIATVQFRNLGLNLI